MKLRHWIPACIAVFSAGIPLLLHHYRLAETPSSLSVSLRWIAAGTFIYAGIKSKSLSAWIFAGMALGIVTGIDFPGAAGNLGLLSQVFLRLIKTIIAPLLFGTLVAGIAGHPNLRQVGRMGWKSLVYFEIVTTLALFIGLAAINISGAGRNIPVHAAAPAGVPEIKQQSPADIILHIFPENVAKSVAEGQVLQVVVFSILFAVGLAMVPEGKRKPVLAFAEGLSEVMFRFTNIIMYFAPFAVGGAIAYTIGKYGTEVFGNLLSLLLTLYIALVIFVFFIFLPVALLFRVPLKKFTEAVAGPVSLAFATASSEAALPRAMEEMEKLGVPRKIVSFVIPAGYSFNLDGTTLYLSLASVFVAQAAGIEMSFGMQLLMVFTLMLTSKGVAGVPRASLVILLGTAASFNLPAEPIFLLLGIDALMDMARTSVNVLGNCLASVVVAKWEGEFHSSSRS